MRIETRFVGNVLMTFIMSFRMRISTYCSRFFNSNLTKAELLKLSFRCVGLFALLCSRLGTSGVYPNKSVQTAFASATHDLENGMLAHSNLLLCCCVKSDKVEEH